MTLARRNIPKLRDVMFMTYDYILKMSYIVIERTLLRIWHLNVTYPCSRKKALAHKTGRYRDVFSSMQILP